MIETEVRDLAVKDYKETWLLQESLMESVKKEKQEKGSGKNYLLLVEHPPVYTLGKSGNTNNLLINTIQLQAKQAEFIPVDRGGDITFHGPGQLVVYPIFDLENFNIGIKEYIYRLEEVVIRTLAGYNILADRLESASGVWLGINEPNPRKICAIGVRCSRFVTMHGFAFNINTDLSYFNYINPCGFVDKGVTSLEKEIGKKEDISKVKQLIVKQFEDVFKINTLGF